MMDNITLHIAFKEKKIEIILKEKINTFSELFQFLKKELAIQNDYDIFVKGEDNETKLLTSANYGKYFIEEAHSILPLIIFENPNLDSQMMSIISEYDQNKNIIKEGNDNYIDGLSLLSSESRVIESQWINNPYQNTNHTKGIKIFTDKCSCCHADLTSIKFLCMICAPIYSIFCEKCEENHEHPVIKYKSLDFSTSINEILSFISPSNNSSQRKPIVISTFINYTLATQCKHKIILPILVNWNTNDHSKKYKVILRNFRDLQTSYEIEEYNLTTMTSNLLITLIPTVYSMGKYDLKIELYFIEQNTHTNTLTIDFEVNEDKEEEALNDYFTDFPKALLLPVHQKQMLRMIHKESISSKPLTDIFFIMHKHKWSVESALEDLL